MVGAEPNDDPAIVIMTLLLKKHSPNVFLKKKNSIDRELNSKTSI